jgi:hypothetical protein
MGASDSTMGGGVVALDKQSQRFVGPDSYLNRPDAPDAGEYDAAGAYDRTKQPPAPNVLPFESGYSDRFAGPDSRYRKGLRNSTIPGERDPSSFPINKTIGKSTGRGAALKAALKATISHASTLGAVAEEQENAVAVE